MGRALAKFIVTFFLIRPSLGAQQQVVHLANIYSSLRYSYIPIHFFIWYSLPCTFSRVK